MPRECNACRYHNKHTHANIDNQWQSCIQSTPPTPIRLGLWWCPIVRMHMPRSCVNYAIFHAVSVLYITQPVLLAKYLSFFPLCFGWSYFWFRVPNPSNSFSNRHDYSGFLQEFTTFAVVCVSNHHFFQVSSGQLVLRCHGSSHGPPQAPPPPPGPPPRPHFGRCTCWLTARMPTKGWTLGGLEARPRQCSTTIGPTDSHWRMCRERGGKGSGWILNGKKNIYDLLRL